MTAPHEFSRTIRSDRLPAGDVTVSADEAERLALARRFEVVAIESLAATVSFEPSDDRVLARGRLQAAFRQSCAVSGEPFANTLDEELAMVFRPGEEIVVGDPEVEIEVDLGGIEEIPFDGADFDLGEAIAQSFALALDPYAEGPEAQAARLKAGIASDDDAPRGLLADALAALTGKPAN